MRWARYVTGDGELITHGAEDVVKVRFGDMAALVRTVIENNKLIVLPDGTTRYGINALAYPEMDVERMALEALKEEDVMHWDSERLPTLISFARFYGMKNKRPAVVVQAEK